MVCEWANGSGAVQRGALDKVDGHAISPEPAERKGERSGAMVMRQDGVGKLNVLYYSSKHRRYW